MKVVVCLVLSICAAHAQEVKITGDITFEVRFNLQDNMEQRSGHFNRGQDSRYEDNDEINDLADTHITNNTDPTHSRHNSEKRHHSTKDIHRSRHAADETRPSRHTTDEPHRSRYNTKVTHHSPYRDDILHSRYTRDETHQSRHITEKTHLSRHTIDDTHHSRYTTENTHHARHITDETRHSEHTMEEPRHSRYTTEETHPFRHSTENTHHSSHITDETRHSRHTTTTTHRSTKTTTVKSVSVSHSSNSTNSSDKCKYKPPQIKHINALLSDMMNQITKVFVRLQHVKSPGGTGGALRHHDSRFKLIDKKQTEFFDQIFTDMINEYIEVCNKSLSSASEALAAPCSHQKAVQEVWSGLLDAAAAVYWRAARRCVKSAPTARVDRVRLRGRLKKARPGLRAKLITRLCDEFSLCFLEMKNSLPSGTVSTSTDKVLNS